MRIKSLDTKAAGKVLILVFLFYFSFLLLFRMFLFWNGPYHDSLIRKQYVLYLNDGEYEKAYQLLSDRIRAKVGNMENFKEYNRIIEKKYEIFGIKEELVRDSVRVNGNIVTFRIKTFFEDSGHTRQILEGKAYLAVVDGKIDRIQSFGHEVLKITDETQA